MLIILKYCYLNQDALETYQDAIYDVLFHSIVFPDIVNGDSNITALPNIVFHDTVDGVFQVVILRVT